MKYQIKDRMSFREFLDIQSVDDVPDEKTVWKYRDIMSESGIGERLFAKFNEQLTSMGLIVNEGEIVDASFVIVPKQRNRKKTTELSRRHAAASNMSMASWNRAWKDCFSEEWES